jgi:hypothetical protein
MVNTQFCLAFRKMKTPVTRDFRPGANCSQFASCMPESMPNQITKPLRMDIMNVEITELKSVEQVTKTDDSYEILTLSFDDLDLVGGGNFTGVAI